MNCAMRGMRRRGFEMSFLENWIRRMLSSHVRLESLFMLATCTSRQAVAFNFEFSYVWNAVGRYAAISF